MNFFPPIPAYIVGADVEAYIEGFSTPSDTNAFNRDMDRAERDIERLLVRFGVMRYPTDAMHLLEMDPLTTSGSFQLEYVYLGNTYTTPVIPYNTDNFALSTILFFTFDASPTPPSTPGTINVNSTGGQVNMPIAPVYISYMETWGSMPLPTVINSTLSPGAGVTIAVTCNGGVMNRRLNPARLPLHALLALKAACCAQFEYRMTMGRPFFVQSQYQSAKTADITTTGRLPKISPKAKEELALAGLVNYGARARP
jgi:hypothetical protein